MLRKVFFVYYVHMTITQIKKRSGSVVDFDQSRIASAISRAYAANNAPLADAELTELTGNIAQVINTTYDEGHIPGVEDIQDIVEKEIAKRGDFEIAKSYILYREEKNKERRRDIFKKRTHLKPYEYPELYEYVDAVRHSYWIHTEFNFVGDVQNFRVNVDEKERNVIRNTMLAIAQIEVAVKTFWGDVYKKIPKPEVGAVGATFA